MILEVDGRSPVPPYEQLRDQLATLIRSGALSPGTRLPAIRQLANDLGLAGGTVGRAYRELESQGYVVARGRHGTVVADGAPASTASSALLEAARRYAAEVRRLGGHLDDAVDAVRAAYASGGKP